MGRWEGGWGIGASESPEIPVTIQSSRGNAAEKLAASPSCPVTCLELRKSLWRSAYYSLKEV